LPIDTEAEEEMGRGDGQRRRWAEEEAAGA